MQLIYDSDRREAPSETDCLRPPTWELACLGGLIIFYIISGLWVGEQNRNQGQFFGPICLGVTLLLSALRMVAIDKTALWASLFWFRISTAFYFGFGSIAHYFFNDYTFARVTAFYFADDDEMRKINLINVTAVLSVLCSARVISKMVPLRKRVTELAIDSSFTLTVALLFLGVGYGIKYLIIVPNAIGASNFALSGAISFFIWLAPTGLFLFTLWCLRHSPRYFVCSIALLATDIALGMLLFSKSEFLLPLLMFILALLLHRISLRRLLLMSFAVLITFSVVEPMVGYGRLEISKQYGALRSASLSERLAILGKYFTEDSANDAREDFQGSLVRFSYIHSAAPAIAQYDNGQPGNSLEHALYIFVPRALWPEKPVFDMGANYTRMIDGTDTSSTWMGYFAEAYWNYGWYGVILTMTLLGVVLLISSRYSLTLIKTGRWMHLPVAFLGIWMGIRTDGVIVTDVLSSIIVMLIFHFIGTLAGVGIRSLLVSKQLSMRGQDS